MNSPPSSQQPDSRLDDALDALVGEFSDAHANGLRPSRRAFLARAPAAARPGLERVLKMIEAGMDEDRAAQSPLSPGMRLGNYELEKEIGRGGMARVWLAKDLELARPVAVKVLRPGLAFEQRHVDRFRREATAIARLSHPNIVQIHGVGSDHGHHWLAMEYVEGPSLATVLEALPQDPDRPRRAEDLARASGIARLDGPERNFEQAVALLLAPIAEALIEAHEHGLVHRDIKPSNILIHRDGRAVIADFGLAKGDDDPALSLTGEGLGTPYYMSPEQAYISGQAVDHRSDIYSLGVTLYEVLGGRRPFVGDSFLEVIESIRSTEPPGLNQINRLASKDATAVVRRAMARDPDDRYGSAALLLADLRALSSGDTTLARREEGGPIRRLLSVMRMANSDRPYEYRSAFRVLGMPLVHIISTRNRRHSPTRVARGWLAIGPVAVGGIAMGTRAYGGVCTGAVAVGLISWGALSAGLLTTGALSLGLFAFAGISLGWVACGGVAAGHIAVGGCAYGKYAQGGSGRAFSSAAENREVFDQLWESWSSFFSTVF